MSSKKPRKPKPAATSKKPPGKPPAPPADQPPSGNGDAYERKRTTEAARSRANSQKGREISPLPSVVDAKRKESCRLSLKLFCETYLSDSFWHAWSEDHLKVIARLESIVLRGGRFALAMPRGSGKTALCEAAALWAILYGHRRFVVIVGASQPAATNSLSTIRFAIETSDAIGEDFPEAAYPIRQLEGQGNRANGQTLNGTRTRISWTEKGAAFPTVEGSKASGSIIRVTGIESKFRGMKVANMRPDMALVDDAQDDESAESSAQTAKRLKLITGAIMGLAGPGKTIAMAIPCTVIAHDDLSSRLLDRKKNPQFRGERMKMVYSFPTEEKLWEKYAELRNESFRNGGEGEEATEFYRANRVAMDAGAMVAWPARFDDSLELSAVQAAMNLKIDNPIAFAAEYQNDPLTEALSGMRDLAPSLLMSRLSGVPRREVPRECSMITAFIDCHKGVLWYAVVAWDAKFGGSIIDYGAWPEQGVPYFRHDSLRFDFASKYRGIQTDDARLYAGLKDLTNALMGAEFRRHESGEPHRINMCLIDRGYKPDVVHRLCRESGYGGILRPSFGHAIGSTGRGVRQWAEVSGETKNPPGSAAWRWGYGKGEHNIGRRIAFDPDEWKGFACDRLSTPEGGYAPVMLYGVKQEGVGQTTHQMIADHLSGEFGGLTRTNSGYEYEKWSKRPNRDVHLWDCFVGCCVAANVAGLRWSVGTAAGGGPPRAKKPPIDIRDLYAAAHPSLK